MRALASLEHPPQSEDDVVICFGLLHKAGSAIGYGGGPTEGSNSIGVSGHSQLYSEQEVLC